MDKPTGIPISLGSSRKDFPPTCLPRNPSRLSPISNGANLSKLIHWDITPPDCPHVFHEDLGTLKKIEPEEKIVFGDVITPIRLNQILSAQSSDTSTKHLWVKLDFSNVLGTEWISECCRNLVKLNLYGSVIPAFRDIGCSYRMLRVIWISNCQLNDLIGIAVACPRLEALFASQNAITSISPLLELSESLRILDLQNNNINEIETLCDALSYLSSLEFLHLGGNPIISTMPIVRLDVSQISESRLSSSEVPIKVQPQTHLTGDNEVNGNGRLKEEIPSADPFNGIIKNIVDISLGDYISCTLCPALKWFNGSSLASSTGEKYPKSWHFATRITEKEMNENHLDQSSSVRWSVPVSSLPYRRYTNEATALVDPCLYSEESSVTQLPVLEMMFKSEKDTKANRHKFLLKHL